MFAAFQARRHQRNSKEKLSRYSYRFPFVKIMKKVLKKKHVLIQVIEIEAVRKANRSKWRQYGGSKLWHEYFNRATS